MKASLVVTALCCWALTGVVAQRQGFKTISEDGCPRMRVVDGEAGKGSRALEFIYPEASGLRISRCFGNGPPECGRNESQQVADAYCQGVGFQFSSFWRATTVNDTLCYPELGGILEAGCNNTQLQGTCQAFERIVCAGGKILRATFEGKGASGIVEFIQNSTESVVEIVLKLSGLPDQKMLLEIHEKPTRDSCNDTGDIFLCEEDGVCIGDLSSRIGLFEGPRVNDTAMDDKVTTFGDEAIEGTSVIIKSKKDEIVGCATLRPRIRIKLPDSLEFPSEELKVDDKDASNEKEENGGKSKTDDKEQQREKSSSAGEKETDDKDQEKGKIPSADIRETDDKDQSREKSSSSDKRETGKSSRKGGRKVGKEDAPPASDEGDKTPVEEVQEVPEEVQEVPEEVQVVPEEVQEVPEEVQEVPEEVQEVPEEVQEVPEEVQEVPEEVQEVPEEVQEVPEEELPVSGTPTDISVVPQAARPQTSGVVTVQPQPDGLIPEVTTQCPPGQTCQIQKCRVDCDDLQTCCRCSKWMVSTGACADDGWTKFQGPPTATCNFNVDCPVNAVCEGVKILREFNGVGFDETCCECMRHLEDGSCAPDQFRVVRGPGDCNFEVAPAEVVGVQDG